MKDWVRFRLKGSTAFCLSVLRNASIPAAKVSAEAGFTLFSVNCRDKERTKSAFLAAGRKIEEVSRTGFLYILKCAPARVGLLVGFLVSTLLIWYYSGFVLSLELKTTSVSPEEVLAVLAEQGVTFPSRVVELDTVALEKAVCSIDSVSHATVKRIGSRLSVTVLSEFRTEPLIDLSIPIALVAAQDAIVTSLVVNSGTALVKVGDTVRAGQILIAPYIEIGPEAQIPVAATGFVSGRVIRAEKRMLFDSEIKSICTGESKTVTQIELGPLKSAIEPPPYESFEIKESRFRIPGLLPLYSVSKTYYRTELRQVECSYSDGYVAEVTAGFEDFATRLPHDAEVVSRHYEIKRLDNLTVLELYYYTEEKIDESEKG